MAGNTPDPRHKQMPFIRARTVHCSGGGNYQQTKESMHDGVASQIRSLRVHSCRFCSLFSRM